MSKFFWVIVAVAIIIVGSGLALRGTFGFKPSSNAGSVQGVIAQAPVTKEVKINAFQYGYDPSVITVKNGETVKITVNNVDVIHGIRIPDLGVSGNDSVEFTAEKTGEFIWSCNNFCGNGHQQMQGQIIIK